MKSSVDRLLRLPLLPDAIEREIITIENIARVNSLNVDVRLLIERTKLRRSLKESRLSPEFQDFSKSFPNSSSCAQSSPLQENEEKWIRLPYLGQLSEKLSRELHRYVYRTGFYTVTKVLDLSVLKDPIPPMEKSGIYLLKCSCGDEYVGQSGRTIKKRLSEHM